MTTRDNRMGALFQAHKSSRGQCAAAGECGSYTADMFREDFPQFTVRGAVGYRGERGNYERCGPGKNAGAVYQPGQ